MEFFREGGMNMWVLVIGFIATLAIGATRTKKNRPIAFLSGCIFEIISAVLGMATGMVAVNAHFASFGGESADHAAVVAQGLSELSNNGTLGCGLALLLGVAALVTRLQAASPADARLANA